MPGETQNREGQRGDGHCEVQGASDQALGATGPGAHGILKQESLGGNRVGFLEEERLKLRLGRKQNISEQRETRAEFHRIRGRKGVRHSQTPSCRGRVRRQSLPE